ncbi:DUF2213 domain-containing protein [Agrobacterium radiobacter]|uniref:DUF2213 domain-containing protein n=1 Tax=Agrobacterium tumefaciens str. B6 TaxID=1183423 RepID=A0A822UZ41_AGRTU|nr:DUF2213 domain-containing protein [Agrobacterium tumefaciens]KWT88006.1 hypothetical protein ASB65_18390 [Agrobacterium tumefaciens str. B6]MQB28200.1 DUF2213 domain-containing protein [Agrobacterium tumefaciens]NTA04995.1 DUF2213 domain-containing protein [Agrobacterium tumefaciens]NTA91590.1 DUF2213 domain-containing protein [Agrobacterium tumefaciens]NTB12740.1 DUF2213 domain-containing protein [Agrobacterium tumefaciens]
MQFTDAVTVSGTRRTADGYLIAEAKSVRTGIQLYSGDEVGKPEMPIVRVYRPAEQVFADTSLQSFTHAPVTMNHPDEAVTAENWKDLAIGEVSTAAKKDGEWVHLPLILKDAKAIAEVEEGKRELSAGYTCELVWGDGVTPDGQQFDATQTNIKINHLAVVTRARAGSQARIGDGASWGAAPFIPDHNPKKETIMTLKTVTVDGIPVEVTDQGAVVIGTLQTRLADANAKAEKAEAAHTAALAAKDAELAKKDAELDAMKAKVLSDADLDKRVQDRADLIAVASVIAKDVKTTGLSDAAIRKAVVAAKLGDAAIAGKADAYIDARFDILAEDAKKEAGADPFARVVSDGLKSNLNDAGRENKAWSDGVSDLNAWRHQKEA